MKFSRSIELRLLDCLVTLVETCSVTRAAELTGMSQPRMSAALGRLRLLFGDALLVRAGQRMVPTERALSIAASVRAGLDRIDAALAMPEEFDPATCVKQFIVAMSEYGSLLTLPALCKLINTRAPHITLAVKVINHAAVPKWLDDGECDLSFGFFSHLGESFHASTLFQDKTVCVARADHPSINGSLSLEQFLKSSHATVGGAPTPVSTIERNCDTILRELGAIRSVIARVPTPLSVARIIAATDVIGILPARLATDFAEFLPLQQLPLPFAMSPFDVKMVWHERLHRDPAHTWLRQQFRAVSRPLRGLEGSSSR